MAYLLVAYTLFLYFVGYVPRLTVTILRDIHQFSEHTSIAMIFSFTASFVFGFGPLLTANA